MSFRAIEAVRLSISREELDVVMARMCEIMRLEEIPVKKGNQKLYDLKLRERRSFFSMPWYWSYKIKFFDDSKGLLVVVESMARGYFYVFKWEMVHRAQSFVSLLRAFGDKL